jgi:general stress protein CsbA
MNLIIVSFIFLSHALAALPFFKNLQAGNMPKTVHFAAIGFILYYDAGLFIEALQLSIGSKYFTPFFNDNPWLVFTSTFFITIVPWLLRIGSNITNKSDTQVAEQSYSQLKYSVKPVFYILVILVSIYFAFNGWSEVSSGDPIWVVRERITMKWEALIILLYLPLHFLAFYTRQSESKSLPGLIFSLGLAAAIALSTLGIGQRTNLLLPVLILVLFRNKISIQKVGIFLAIAVIAAAALLPFFKWQSADNADNVGANIGVLVAETIEADFYRGNVLATTLQMTEIVGTKLMPYPLSGYVYTILFYVPRGVAPFKGWSTSQTFTATIDRTPVADTFWAFGVGIMEELLLNVGYLLAMPCLVIFGMGLGILDKISLRIPSLLIPTRLAAIWMCGYESSTIMLVFGTMAVVAFGLHMVFVQKPKSFQIISNQRKLT